jgi:hypothetical protein
VKLNELNLNQVVGDYGAAALKQVGNRITGKAEGNLSVQDKIAKDKFISDFIGRASTNLNSAIQSGLVDPKAKAAPQAAVANPNAKPKPVINKKPTATPPGQQPAAPASAKPVATPGQQPAAPGAPKTPEQIRKEKQAAAGQVAQQQMGANPATTKPGAPIAPTQPAAVQQPGMTQDGTPHWDPTTGKGAKYDGVTGQTTPAYQAELDKQKAAGEEQAKARLAATQSAQQATASPTATTASTPSTATGASAEQAALDKMKQKNPKLAGMMAQAGMDADGNDKMTPQQTAALKGRLKAGATATSGQSGFKNYVGGSGERMTGVDKSGAPVFQKIQREGTYSKLDYILESIININEAPAAQSISQYLQNMFTQYLKVPITDPAVKTQVKKLADMAQASYPKMTNALTQLANLGFATSYSQGTGEEQPATAPASAFDAIKAGFKQGMGGTSVPPEVGALDAKAAAQDQELDSLYGKKSELQNRQLEIVMNLIKQMSKDEKQELLTSITKPEAAKPEAEPANNAGAGAFDQMSKQLQQPKTTANPIDTRQQKLNTNKVKAGNKGAPTPDEQAKLQQRIQQQLAVQA